MGPSPLHRVLYTSRVASPVRGRIDQAMAEIVATSAPRNAAAGVTAALVEVDGWFIQAIKGPTARVAETWGRIRGDRRHEAMTLIDGGPIEERAFAGPAGLRSRRAPSRIAATAMPTGRGFNPEKLTAAEALGLLAALTEPAA